MAYLSHAFPVALVTGASSGIGAATAKLLAIAGYRVVLVARRGERLERVAAEIRQGGGGALVVAADLTDEAERERAVAEVIREWSRIDVLVNNAGVGWNNWFEELPADRRQAMLALNVAAVVHLTALVLPGMRQRRSGRIVNVSSTAADITLPTIVLYSATKSFVDALSNGLRRELTGTGVKVTTIKPGPVRTEFRRVASSLSPDESPELERGVSSEVVARAILDAIRHDRATVYVPGVFALARYVTPLATPFLDRFGRVIAQVALRIFHAQPPGR